MKRLFSNQLENLKNDEKVLVKGFCENIRLLGKIAFIRLRDIHGSFQIVFLQKDDPELFDSLSKLSLESVIEVNGSLKKSKEAKEGFEVVGKKLVIHSISEQPVPLNISGKIESDISSRLDWRFIDLRVPENNAIFKIQSTISMSFRKHFEKKAFLEIQPPSMIGAASEGGAELYEFKHFEKKAYLAQSPQLYKQMMMSAGFEKVFMITPVWRAEPHATTRHVNESRQMDVEISYSDMSQALKELEDVLSFIIKEVSEKNKKELDLLKVKLPKPKFNYLTYTKALELLKKHGIKLVWGDDLSPESEKKLCEVLGDFVFVTNWPTNIRAFYSMPDPDNPKECFAYDAILNGTEILSGAVRVHDLKMLEGALTSKGLNPKQFSFYLDAFRYGCPPHAGWSIGLERITMTLLGFNNIKETTLFPRDRNRLTP